MAAKITAENTSLTVQKPKVRRNPVKIVATFVLLNEFGDPVEMPKHRLAVQTVTRDLEAFADQVLANPSEVGLFAKIEVPFLEG